MATTNLARGRRPVLNYRGKQVIPNGSATALSLFLDREYNYVTTSAASIAVTMPGTGASVDGAVVAVCFSAAVGTLTWAAGANGATIVGAPSAAAANTVYRFIYDHATTSWYPF